MHDAVKDQLEQQTADLSTRLSKVSVSKTKESETALNFGAVDSLLMHNWVKGLNQAALLVLMRSHFAVLLKGFNSCPRQALGACVLMTVTTMCVCES